MLSDIDHLVTRGGVSAALDDSHTTILEHLFVPAAATTPWQLEGTRSRLLDRRAFERWSEETDGGWFPRDARMSGPQAGAVPEPARPMAAAAPGYH